MALLTVEEVKTMLKLYDDTSDNLISVMIPLIEDFLRRKCRDDFPNGFPPGIKIPAVIIINHFLNDKGIQSERIGDYSVEFFGNLPQSVESLLKPYRKLKFV